MEDTNTTKKSIILVSVLLIVGVAVAVIVILNMTAKSKYINELAGNLYYMQDMLPEMCQNLEIGDSIQLKDSRDEKEYWVRKMEDENCWMTQNLDLDITEVGLSAEDSDIGNVGSLNEESKLWNKDSAIKPEATSKEITKVYSPSAVSEKTTAASWDPGDYYYSGKILEDYNEEKNCDESIMDFSECSSHFSEKGDTHYHVGNLYQWYTAVAGSRNNASEIAPDSICPKGWRLPVGGANGVGDGSVLGEKGGYDTVASWVNEPNYFVMVGGIDENELKNAGAGGYIWTSTAMSKDTNVGVLGIGFRGASGMGIDRPTFAYRGLSVRCILRQ